MTTVNICCSCVFMTQVIPLHLFYRFRFRQHLKEPLEDTMEGLQTVTAKSKPQYDISSKLQFIGFADILVQNVSQGCMNTDDKWHTTAVL